MRRIGAQLGWLLGAGLLSSTLSACAEEELLLGIKDLTAATTAPTEEHPGPNAEDADTSQGCEDCPPKSRPNLTEAEIFGGSGTRPAIASEGGTPPDASVDPNASSLVDARIIPPEAGPSTEPTTEGAAPIDPNRPDTGSPDPECVHVIAFNTAQECMGKLVCSDHESTATCIRRGTQVPWGCETELSGQDESPSEPAGERMHAAFLLQDVPEALSACSIALDLFDSGSPWDVRSGFDCDQQGSADDYACEFTPGCWHALDLPEGLVSVWEPSEPGIECTTLQTPSGALACTCATGKQSGSQLVVVGTSSPNACYDAQAICADDAELTFEGEETCSVAAQQLDLQYCSRTLDCGPSAQLGALTLQISNPNEVICTSEVEGVAECFCNANEVASLSFDVASPISDELCGMAGEVCYPETTLTQQGARSCPIEITSVEPEKCEVRLACQWAALAGDTEVQAHAQSELHCAASPAQDGRDGQWSCICGVGSPLFDSIDFGYALGADAATDCQAMAEQCAMLVEQQATDTTL